MLSFITSTYAGYVESNKKAMAEAANKKFDDEAKRIAAIEDPRDGTVPIDFKIRQINYHQLRRKMAFTKDRKMVSKPEYDDLGRLLSFKTIPDILPVERISNFTLEELELKRIASLKAEEVKDPQKLKPRSVEELANIHNFDYEEATEPLRKDFLSRFKLIRKRQHDFLKPVAVIFNPKAGRGNDVRELINIRFEFVGIKTEFIETNHRYHAYEITHSIDLTKYQAIIVCGGDGTMSEAISGMLSRPDKRRLPVGLVPNGHSNDLCQSLGIKSFD
jgi:hypothetical protein